MLISGPSAAGKTTLIEKIRDRAPELEHECFSFLFEQPFHFVRRAELFEGSIASDENLVVHYDITAIVHDSFHRVKNCDLSRLRPSDLDFNRMTKYIEGSNRVTVMVLRPSSEALMDRISLRIQVNLTDRPEGWRQRVARYEYLRSFYSSDRRLHRFYKVWENFLKSQGINPSSVIDSTDGFSLIQYNRTDKATQQVTACKSDSLILK